MSRLPYQSPSRQPLLQGGGGNYRQSPPIPQDFYASNVPQAQGIPMKVGRCPSDTLAKTNYLFVSPKDFDPAVRHVLVNGQFVFSIKPDEGVPPRQIGTTLFHRRWASLSLNEDIIVTPYRPEGANIYLGKIDLEVGFLRKVENKELFDTEEMSRIFIQVLVFDFHGNNLQVVVRSVHVVDFVAMEKG
ncbi:8855_t:CDS:2, partial [Ambispora leptoticha]